MISRILAFFAVLALLLPPLYFVDPAVAREWPTTAGAEGEWPSPPVAAAASAMEPIDLSDGSWTVYDAASRTVTPAALVTGTHKNVISQTYAGASTTIGTGVLYYRPIRDADGAYPANVKGQAHRISVSWSSRLEISASKQYIVAAGYLNGNPATAGTVIRFYGLQQSDGTGTQLTGRLAPTVGTASWSTLATAANPARAVHVMAQRLSIDGAFQVTPAIDTDGHGDTTNTVVNTYVFNESRITGAETTLYEAIWTACANACGAADYYLSGESGLVSPADGQYHYSPEVGGDQQPLHVYVDGDSTWLGGAAGVGITGGASGVQRAFQEFELRDSGSTTKRRPVRFVGYTGSPMGFAVHKYLLDGQVDTGASSGRTMQTAATQAAARATSLDNAGRDLLEREVGEPDVWLLMLGMNDAQAGRTEAQIRADAATTAAAVKGVFPAADVVIGCVYKTNTSVIEYKNFCDTLVAGSLPAGVDAVWDYRPYWGNTDAFSVSGVDGHPSVVASPTGLAPWNGPYAMNPAGAAYSQCGTCMIAYHTWKFLRGSPPPLLAGEVAPE